MFDLGFRRGEVVGLDVGDVDRDGRRLWVLGKGKAQREQRSLPVPTMEAIACWLSVRRRMVDDDEPALLVNVAGLRPGRRMTGNGLYRVIRSLGDLTGIRARPHGIRHASITAALDTATATCAPLRPTRGMPIRRRR